MKQLTFTECKLEVTPDTVDNVLVPVGPKTIDISSGSSIQPFLTGSLIKVDKTDPKKGIIGEAVYYAQEHPSALKEAYR